MDGAGQRGEAQARLAAGEAVRRLQERRGVPEGAEPSLLGEQLLVGHRVDGVGERKGRAAGSKGSRVSLVAGFGKRKLRRRPGSRTGDSPEASD